jgi:hypothetical protein
MSHREWQPFIVVDPRTRKPLPPVGALCTPRLIEAGPTEAYFVPFDDDKYGPGVWRQRDDKYDPPGTTYTYVCVVENPEPDPMDPKNWRDE